MESLVKDFNQLIIELSNIILDSENKEIAVFKVKDIIEKNIEDHSLENDDVNYIWESITDIVRESNKCNDSTLKAIGIARGKGKGK